MIHDARMAENVQVLSEGYHKGIYLLVFSCYCCDWGRQFRYDYTQKFKINIIDVINDSCGFSNVHALETIIVSL